MTDRLLAPVRFFGDDRDVYQAPDGRQYVLGYDGEPVFGVWVWTEDVEADAPVRMPSRWQRGCPGPRCDGQNSLDNTAHAGDNRHE